MHISHQALGKLPNCVIRFLVCVPVAGVGRVEGLSGAGYVVVCVFGCVCVCVCVCVDGWMCGWVCGWVDGCVDVWMGVWMGVCVCAHIQACAFKHIN